MQLGKVFYLVLYYIRFFNYKYIKIGFVDAHTHPVWSGDRVHEFSMKLAGFLYILSKR